MLMFSTIKYFSNPPVHASLFLSIVSCEIPEPSFAVWALNSTKISGNLGCPVGGQKEIIPGAFAARNNNGITVDGRDKAVVERVQGRVSVVARFALVEGEELRGCGCLNVGCYNDVG